MERYRKKSLKLLSVLIALLFIGTTVSVPLGAQAAGDPIQLNVNLNLSSILIPYGHAGNWAGISSLSQFSDEKGNFCFAYEENGSISVRKTTLGKVTSKITIAKLYPQFGAITCDKSGNLYVVWGKTNTTDNRTVNTVFVTKHDSNGKLLATAGDSGSVASYYGDDFNTQSPFSYGNCDVAINGNLLMVNYARGMYSGHQSNGLLTVNTTNMSVVKSFSFYNSHSFDQRVTPYSKNGGFLLASQGDCFPRGFTTALTDASSVRNTVTRFNFWVEKNAYNNYDMMQLNRTYARLGNIVETSKGAALIACSGKALSESVKTQPYDVFVQVFDPDSTVLSADGYITSGTRTGLAGNNGDTKVTDYGVKWLTNAAGCGKTVNAVQAIATDEDTIVVLYELYMNNTFDSTWYMVLGADGNVKRQPVFMGNTKLNIDEDPVFAQGAVQWVSNEKAVPQWLPNDSTYDAKLVLHSILIKDTGNESTDTLYREWVANTFNDVSSSAYYANAVKWACMNGITTGTGDCRFSPDMVCSRAQMVTFLWRAAGSPPSTGSADTFTDVDKSAYYYQALRWACEKGITTGTGAGKFSPNMSCSRGQMAEFLYRFSNSPAVEGEQKFTDVNENDYFNTAVIWADSEGVTNGIGHGLYGPDVLCTRGQMVMFLYKLLA